VELSLPVAVLDGDTLDVLLGGGLAVSVEVADGRGDRVREVVGSAVRELLTLRVADALRVLVALDEPVSVSLGELVAVWLLDLEGVGGTKQIVTASTKSQDTIMLSTALMTRNWSEYSEPVGAASENSTRDHRETRCASTPVWKSTVSPPFG
jgi:hypothetical protein